MKARNGSIILTVLASILISICFLSRGQYWPVILLVTLLLTWIFTLNRDLSWMGYLELFTILCMSAYALFLEISAYPVFAGTACALAGWDLMDFNVRQKYGSRKHEQEKQELIHVKRLGSTFAIGLVLSYVAINLELSISFEWIAILTLLTALGLGKLISNLMKAN